MGRSERRANPSLAAATAALLWLFAAPAAQAHLVTTGLGPLYDGIGHFLFSPEDAIPALALALLAGQRGTAASRMVVFAVPAAWLAFGLIGFCMPAIPLFYRPKLTAVIAMTFLIPGLLVASNGCSSKSIVVLVSIFFSGLHGFFDGLSLREVNPVEALLTLLGIAASVFTVVVLSAAFVVSLRAQWTRIAVRVAGSWIAATGLLLLGWSIRRAG